MLDMAPAAASLVRSNNRQVLVREFHFLVAPLIGKPTIHVQYISYMCVIDDVYVDMKYCKYTCDFKWTVAPFPR